MARTLARKRINEKNCFVTLTNRFSAVTDVDVGNWIFETVYFNDKVNMFSNIGSGAIMKLYKEY